MPLQDYPKLLKQWAQRRALIRRWHKEGQSMRAIANKLDLSVQRVHKIVTSAKPE